MLLKHLMGTLNNAMWLIILRRNCYIRSQWCEYFMRAITPVLFVLPNILHSTAGWWIGSYFCSGGQGESVASASVCRSLSGEVHRFICNTVFPFEVFDIWLRGFVVKRQKQCCFKNTASTLICCDLQRWWGWERKVGVKHSLGISKGRGKALCEKKSEHFNWPSRQHRGAQRRNQVPSSLQIQISWVIA